MPGSDKATLQLGNGAVIQLDSSGKDNFISQGSARISAQKGRLSYAEASGALPGAAHLPEGSGPLAYNILSTPKGGQYQVVLQDGTRVWLNAASSLKYPAVFNGKDRTVELTGEAYFEVAKDVKRAFHVQLRNRLQVEVLGTGFDVMAYPEEGAINTTLVNGSVRLVKDGQSVLLKPGQQGVLGENAATFQVGEASLEHTLAWKNGIFEFDNLSLQTIMRQVARWYDVDIDYKVNMENQVYSGTISRQGNLSELLKLLEYTGTVHFTIDGKKINVTK
jgi:transmembrane sensor